MIRFTTAATFALMAFTTGLISTLFAQNSPATQSSPATHPYSPANLPGNGAAQHPFVYAGEWNYPKHVQSIFVVRDGKIDWQYDIPTNDGTKTLEEFSDVTMLSNGNVVFARKTGAGEVTPDKKLIWNYDAPKGTEVHVIQPLGIDRIMFVQSGNPAKLFITNITTGKTEKELVLPVGNPKTPHAQFRRVRITKANTILVAHMDMGKVAEYDMDGKEIWSVAVASPWSANRLDNGNTLIASNRGFAREVNSEGKTVWEFSQKDVPDIKLFVLQEADRLSNGNTLVSNWCPNGIKDPKLWRTSVQLLEVTPEKKVVWALRAWEPPVDLGPASCIQLLDEPGIPENKDQRR